MSDKPILQGQKGYLVNEVILHCGALSDGVIKRFAKMTAEAIRAEIEDWHLARGFNSFGYHGLFMPDGKFLAGRPVTQIGAHVAERNRGTLGYLMLECVPILKMGRFEDFFTEAQRKAVRAKIADLPGIRWVTGHNDYANRLCPGFKVRDEDWLP